MGRVLTNNDVIIWGGGVITNANKWEEGGLKPGKKMMTLNFNDPLGVVEKYMWKKKIRMLQI